MKTTKIQTINGIRVQHIAIEKTDSKEVAKKAYDLPENTVLAFSSAMGDDLDEFKKYFTADGIEIDMNNVKTVIEYQPDGLKI